MSLRFTVGEWIFEASHFPEFEGKIFKGRKVKVFGRPYLGVVDIIISNNEVHVEGLLMRVVERFTRDDFKAIKEAVRIIGFNDVNYERYKSNKRVKKSLIK